jgi:hypothetical protein
LPEGRPKLTALSWEEIRLAFLGQKQALGSMPMTRIDGANHLKQGFKSLKEDKKAKKLKH